MRRLEHLLLWLGFAAVVAANSDWIFPFLRFRNYKTASNYWFQFRGLHDIAFLYSRETSILFAAITVLGVIGLVRLRRHRPLVTLVLSVSAAFYFVVAFYGARVPALANTEPGRYLVPFAFLLTLPAAVALAPWLERLQRRVGPQLATIGLVVIASLNPVLSLADNLFFDVHQVGARVDARFVELMRFLERRTTPDARILFETPGGFYNSSDLLYGGHLQALVPIYTGREVIGGPYPVNFLLHSVVDFKNGELLGRTMRDWTPTELGRFLDNYNIGWVVCWSNAARSWLDARTGMATRIGEFDRFRVHEVARPHGFLLKGAGHVTADYNRIEVTGAAGEELVLSYHWLESLRSSPPIPLSRYPIPGDPIGLIRVRPGGITHFVIHNSY